MNKSQEAKLKELDKEKWEYDFEESDIELEENETIVYMHKTVRYTTYYCEIWPDGHVSGAGKNE